MDFNLLFQGLKPERLDCLVWNDAEILPNAKKLINNKKEDEIKA